MPEYQAPGVYVEETSFRSKSIEGVSTTTTAFVGPTRYGPVEDEPEILTSLLDFERTYGDGRPLWYADEDAAPQSLPAVDQLVRTRLPNYMWHAVRAFFENGGARLYVKRVFRDVGIGDNPAPGEADERTPRSDGRATFALSFGSPAETITIGARFPGAAGERQVRLTLQRGLSILTAAGEVRGLQDRDVVLIERDGSPDDLSMFALAHREEAPDGSTTWEFSNATDTFIAVASPGDRFDLSDLDPTTDRVSIVTVSLTDVPPDGSPPTTWQGLALDPLHNRAGAADSIFARFDPDTTRRADRLGLPVTVEGPGISNGVEALTTITGYANAVRGVSPGRMFEDDLIDSTSPEDARSIDFRLEGGHDGRRPTAAEYEGAPNPNVPYKLGLRALEDLEDVSIVAAPGSTSGYEGATYQADATTIINLLIGHCERMRYRIAVLDSGDQQRVSQVRAMRAQFDSKHAALYYPWVMIQDPISQDELAVPPSGFVAGIYARNDRLRAVYKAPANEVVTLALRFETMLNRAQQEVLNPEGVNCFRFFEGRGNRLWGARTISSDPEWKYVNLRRYFAYLERSIDVGTQWAVFEPNGELLWANVRRTISDFLLNEFQMGALLGDKPERAYFVKCDRTTMTQNDLDNGRLVCLIGVAPLRPAEFVIFRIGQWTADRKV